MENLIIKAFEYSPMLALAMLVWYFTRKDYNKLLNDTQEQNEKREEKYQKTIDKLTDKLNIIDDIKEDLKVIKDKI